MLQLISFVRDELVTRLRSLFGAGKVSSGVVLLSNRSLGTPHGWLGCFCILLP